MTDFAEAQKADDDNDNDMQAKMIERGRDYEKWDLGNGQRRMVLGVDPWVLDPATNTYKPHILNVINSTHVEVQSGMVGLIIGPDYSIITGAGDRNDERVKEYWVINDGNKKDQLITFISRWITENATGVYVTNTYSLDVKGTEATVEITTAIPDGRPAQRIVEFVSGIKSDQDAQDIEIERHWIPLTDIDDVIFDAGESRDVLSSVAKSRVSAQEKAKNNGKTTAALVSENDHSPQDSIHFKDDRGRTAVFENLRTAGEKFKRVDYRNDLITFTYGNFESASDTKLVDDTFTNNTPIEDGYVETNAATGTACPSDSYAKSTSDTLLITSSPRSSNTSACLHAYVEWSIAPLPDDATITGVFFKVDIATVGGTKSCSIVGLANAPSNRTAQELWNDIGAGTVYHTGSSACFSVATGPSTNDLGTTAVSDLQSKLGVEDWFALGIRYNGNRGPGSVSTGVQSSEDPTADPKPTLEVTYSVPVTTVTIPINLIAGDGTQTPFAAGNFTISGDGCTGELGHNGSPAVQNFACNPDSTITITAPSSATVRGIFSNGQSSVQFTSCSADTCTQQNYTVFVQYAISITLHGVDSDVNVDVTRTQLGSSGTSQVPGETLTVVWGDEGSELTVPDVAIVTAGQDRFKSYDSLAARTIEVVDSAQSLEVDYQHEYNTLFRIHEEHLGHFFIPMPLTTFTGTIITSNGTQLAMTFDTQVTDDHLQPAGGRIWVPNGTTSWVDIIWRGLVVHTGGNVTISQYGIVDIESTSKHYGFPGDRHIRVAVDRAEEIEEHAEFDSNVNTLRFNATANGQRNVIVEFMTISFDDVSQVKVDGEVLSPSNWFVTKQGTSDIGLLIITGITFGDRTIEVKFVLAPGTGTTGGTAGGGGGGGGGGGAGGSIQFPPFTPPGGQQQPSLGLDVLISPVHVDPGTSAEFVMRITWTGAASVTITNIEFKENSEWFTVLQDIPATATIPLEAGQNALEADVPVRVAVPYDVQGSEVRVPVKVVAYANGVFAEKEPIAVLQIGSSPNLVFIMAGAFGGVVLAGIIAAAFKNKPRTFGPSRNYGRRFRVRSRY